MENEETKPISPEDISYKWKRIIASKAYGGKTVKLSNIESQELIDDIESINIIKK